MKQISRRSFLAASAAGAVAAMGGFALAAQGAGTTDSSAHHQPAKQKIMTSNKGHRALKPANTALVLVDHQVGTIGWAGELVPEERDQLKKWARVIARLAKSAGMPIVLTSSLETEAQGPLLPEFKTIMPEEYEKRIKRVGVINAWDDPAFAGAVRATGKKNF